MTLVIVSLACLIVGFYAGVSFVSMGTRVLIKEGRIKINAEPTNDKVKYKETVVPVIYRGT